MCYRVECRECGRPSYGGCGAHVEQVLGDVPVEHRCQCRAAPRPPAPRASASWLHRFLTSQERER